ncbi:RsfA family transcriptional regulator [Paenibacillus sp. CFBP 13594]|uniref:RsfA family transcriptional regulator n=1 Tax=Paenibacillus sp. CFBP 13594 TaxID=2774037 RepID=UPI001781EA66|nr:RsfA family transcriptional regulator [Paenibacillus sp. CFBP 13594]MBD8839415.1 RsfA family transcriptional regulator [Paenibacillus sp. CFBP 13594]
MKRSDSWSSQDDNLLTQTVLSYIEGGKTQLQAFDDSGELLDRTPAACGFRWNSFLRHKFKKEINEAKIIKNQNNTSKSNTKSQSLVNFDDIIKYLYALKQDLLLSEAQIQQLKAKIRDVSLEIDSRRNEMSLNTSQNREALATLITKATELGLFNHNKKPAI